MKYIGFRNWDRYQTRKKKEKARLYLVNLHCDLMTDPKILDMSDSEFRAFVTLLLIARRHDNRIPLIGDIWPQEWGEKPWKESGDDARSSHAHRTLIEPSSHSHRTFIAPILGYLRAMSVRRRGKHLPDFAFLWRLNLLCVFESAPGVGEGEGYGDRGSSAHAQKKNVPPSFNPRPGKKLSVHDHNQQVLENVFGSVGSDDEG